MREALAADLARRVMQRIQSLGATVACRRRNKLSRMSASVAHSQPGRRRARRSRSARCRRVADRHGARLVELAPHETIPGSYWGESEAGLIGDVVYVRADTPAHSLLHELCHYVCMDDERRAALATDAGGNDDEECAVCYLQVLLAQGCEVSAPSVVCRHGRMGLQLSRRLGARVVRGRRKLRSRLAVRARLIDAKQQPINKLRRAARLRLRECDKYAIPRLCRRTFRFAYTASSNDKESARMTAEQDADRQYAADADARAQSGRMAH